jgi:hypothetical protein
VLAALAVLPVACAKFPANGETQNTHLIFRMEVAGHIKNGPWETGANYIYMVAVYPSVDLFPTQQGPIPVIAPPWGNGFVAGNATHFIQYDFVQPYPYTVYKFANPDMLAWGITGPPLIVVTPDQNSTFIQFEIDLSQITPDGVQPADLQSVLVNFLTMDKVPQGNQTTTKLWDALGDGRTPDGINQFVRIPLTTSRTYLGSRDFPDLEPEGDVQTGDPDLDIVDWSVEVRRP